MTPYRILVAFSILTGSVASTAENIVEPTTGLAPQAVTPMPQAVKGILQKFCLDCHGAEDPKGGVTLSHAQNSVDVYHEGRVWNKLIRVTRNHSMPPKSEEAPTEEDRQLLSQWVETSLRSAKCDEEQEPGRVTFRRLNRTEYENTLRDLLGTTVDAARELPVDPAGNGFDNQGDTLFIPPVLMEKYLDTTKRILNEALADRMAKEKLFVVVPSESITRSQAAHAILSKFLPRAFRRPVTEEEIAARVKIVERALERNQPFEDAIKVSVQSILLSPYFLFG